MNKIICLFFLFLIGDGFAQITNRTGSISRINLNQKFKKDWKLNYQLENRIIFSENYKNESSSSNLRYSLTDISLIISKKTGLKNSFAAGYLMRFRNGSNEQRFIQQFTLVTKYNAFRLAHRFSTDQTLRKQQNTIFRLRYRLSSEIPLNGYSVDKNEFYLKINHEYLNIFESSEYDLEIRLVPLIGYVFKDSNKLELGFDHRISNFINNSSRNVSWFTINWFVSI